MSASIVYCVEQGTNDICVDVYVDGVQIVDEHVEYPYTNAPTADLQQCLEQYKTLINDASNNLISASYNEPLVMLSTEVNELVLKHNRLFTVLIQRPDYTP